MAVARINRELAAVDLSRASSLISVCTATRDEWRAYLESEDQVLKSAYCEWIKGAVYIVEIPSREHQCFTRQLEVSLTRQPAFVECMQYYGSSVIANHPQLPDYQPDNSYGPVSALKVPLPRGVNDYLSWCTLIVEVGKTRGWGYEAGMLDWKAHEWSRFPGVRFILCVAVSGRLGTAEYKLYTVKQNDNNRAQRLPDTDPVPVVAPRTVVTLDSRELLGLPRGANLPVIAGEQLPDPAIDLDLFEVLEQLDAISLAIKNATHRRVNEKMAQGPAAINCRTQRLNSNIHWSSTAPTAIKPTNTSILFSFLRTRVLRGSPANSQLKIDLNGSQLRKLPLQYR